jgi:hypothetical protein
MTNRPGSIHFILALVIICVAVSAQVGCQPATPIATTTPAVVPITTPLGAAVPPDSTASATPSPTAVPIRITSNVIDFLSHTITKNFWGAPASETLTGDIFLNGDNSYGWDWNRADPQMKAGVNGVLPIYPNVRVGADPGQASNNRLFPVMHSDINQLTFSLDYQYPETPTGQYNFAYQMYFSDVANPGLNAAPRAEVMIWIHNTFGQPPTTYRGDYTDGINNYSLYSWTMADGRGYYSFIMKDQSGFNAHHEVDAKKLLDNLSLSPDWYLLGIHLGNEILIGSGKLQIQQLTIDLNGNKA